MIKDFKFFHGFTSGNFIINTNGNQVMTVAWDGTVTINTNTENELIRILSEEISRSIDDEIINELTIRINGGSSSIFEGPIIGFNNNVA